MNRDAFESLLWDISEKSEWPSPGPADAIDTVMVEFDRLCWHYPEKSELPQVNESGSVDVIIEGYNEIWDIDEYKDRDDYKRHWIEQNKRWRYIE